MTLSVERGKQEEFPSNRKFTDAQDEFLTRLVERRYRNFNFSQLADEESEFFRKESYDFVQHFGTSQHNTIASLSRKDKRSEAEELRALSFGDLTHFAHNGLMEWESRIKRCSEGTDAFITACTEAYEWLKIARLAEYVMRKGRIGKRTEDHVVWPRHTDHF